MLSNYLKQEKDFTTCDHLLALFTCARIQGCRLDEAAASLGLAQDLLAEAVKYRYHIALTTYPYTADYGRSIEEGCRRLASAN